MRMTIKRASNGLNQLRLYSKEHNKLNIITDLTGNIFAIYTHNHIIYKTTCIEVSKINASNIVKSEKCYEDVFIEIELKNNTIKAFLTKYPIRFKS